MAREPEIVVAREGDELAAVDPDARALRRFQRAPGASQSGGVQRLEGALEAGEKPQRHVAGVIPNLSSSARSASTPGLAVVSSLSP